MTTDTGNSYAIHQRCLPLVPPAPARVVRPQESLVTRCGNDLVLTGGDDWGMSYAVYDFVENEAGYRCYAPYPGGEVFRKTDSLRFSGKETRRRPAFDGFRVCYTSPMMWRESIKAFARYSFRNRGTRLDWEKYGEGVSFANDIGLVDRYKQHVPGHALFYYVPAHDKTWSFWGGSGKPALKGLFGEHPDYFSLNEKGERVDNAQLCFSNLELRRLFTERVLEAIAARGPGIYMIGSNDFHAGTYCFCPGCLKLQETYNCTGGPLEWLQSHQVADTVGIVAAGGHVLPNGATETLGTLDLDGALTLDCGGGDVAFSFADSSALDWSGGTLTIDNFGAGDAIRFGTDANALTGAQLALISLNGATPALSDDGYLVTVSADLQASVTEGDIPLSVVFDGSGSSAMGGAIVSYEWDLGDGATATGAVVSHTYALHGTFVATLVVRDALGSWGRATASIVVHDVPNRLPYTESFEGIATNADLGQRRGWDVPDPEVTHVVLQDYSAHYTGGAYPLPQADHTRVLAFEEHVGNDVQGDSNALVRIEMVVQPLYRD